MPLSYQDMKSHLFALTDAYRKKLDSGLIVFNKQHKLKLVKNCEKLQDVLDLCKDNQFALIECMTGLLSKYGQPATNKKNIRDKFYDKMRELLDQLIICESASDICKQNGITPFSQKIKIKLQDDIARHSAILYKNIYSKTHVLDHADLPSDEIARAVHGVQHVNRVAYYIPVLANLYRRYGNEEAAKLTNEDIKLIQIAALFHDAARRNGTGKDEWDHESGLLAYDYLINVLKIPNEKACLLAEAIINKDTKEGRYYKLIHNKGGMVCWKIKTKTTRNIYQKLLHDADSLDIIRVKHTYNAEYLDFHNELAKTNPHARKEMGELICEIRSLIENQGDGYLRQDEGIKKVFECENGYEKTIEQVAVFAKEKNQYRVLSSLYTPNIESLKLTDLRKMKLVTKSNAYDANQALTEENMRAALEAGIVYSRGMVDPSAIVKKIGQKKEIQVELEIRKTLRRKNVATRTNKPNKLEKHGNPNRSVSLLGFGAMPYSASGFLIVDKDKKHKKIKYISKSNIRSGFGKKSNVETLLGQLPSTDQKKSELKELVRTLEMGGGLNNNSKTFHSEIIYHIDSYDAIYFTNDAVFGNRSKKRNVEIAKPFHPHAALLQAILLQKEYESKSGICLPIFEYSGIHKTMCAQPNLREDEITNLWIVMCTDFIKNQIKEEMPELFTMTTDQIKAFSMYAGLEIYIGSNSREMGSADKYLSSASRAKIDSAIQNEIEKLRKQFLEKIQNKFFELFSPLALSVLQTNNEISSEMRARMARKIKFKLRDQNGLQAQLMGFVQSTVDMSDTVSYMPVNFIYLVNYAKLINDNKAIDNLKQIAITVINQFKNVDFNIFSSGPFGRINARSMFDFVRSINEITKLFSIQNEVDDNFFVDGIIKIKEIHNFIHSIILTKCEDHPKIIKAARELLIQMPNKMNVGDLDIYIKNAKKYGFTGQEINDGVRVLVDNIIKKNIKMRVDTIVSIVSMLIPADDFLNKKLFNLLKLFVLWDVDGAITIFSLLAVLKNQAEENKFNIDLSVCDEVLTKLSVALLEEAKNDMNFYEMGNQNTTDISLLLDEVNFNTSPVISDKYKNNMFELIQSIPNDESGKIFVEKIHALNLKLGFDLNLYKQPKKLLSDSGHSLFAAKGKAKNKKPMRLIEVEDVAKPAV